MIDARLTYLQALKVMMKFLDDYYEETLSDDIGSLLGDISLLEDNSTADSAAWSDWIKAINQLLKNDVNIQTKSNGTEHTLTAMQTFRAMINFLDDYGQRTSSDEVRELLKKMKLLKNNSASDSVIWHKWTKCFNEILKNNGESYGYLELHK